MCKKQALAENSNKKSIVLIWSQKKANYPSTKQGNFHKDRANVDSHVLLMDHSRANNLIETNKFFVAYGFSYNKQFSVMSR